MSKSELACKLQGSAIGFIEVTRDLGFWKTASLSDKGNGYRFKNACFMVCYNYFPLEVIYLSIKIDIFFL
jgi:hypothetical protein